MLVVSSREIVICLFKRNYRRKVTKEHKVLPTLFGMKCIRRLGRLQLNQKVFHQEIRNHGDGMKMFMTFFFFAITLKIGQNIIILKMKQEKLCVRHNLKLFKCFMKISRQRMGNIYNLVKNR
ncbi:hypothetical protein CR513_54388, partial [Mucuna pruriens]